MHEPILDLTIWHRRQQHGDISAFLTWLRDARRTPALVLVRTALLGREGAIPCIVPLTRTWVWSEEIGDPRQAAQTCIQFAASLGLNPHNATDCIRVMSIIRDHIGDLVLMPPKPTEARVVADVIRTEASGRQHHDEVVENV